MPEQKAKEKRVVVIIPEKATPGDIKVTFYGEGWTRSMVDRAYWAMLKNLRQHLAKLIQEAKNGRGKEEPRTSKGRAPRGA